MCSFTSGTSTEIYEHHTAAIAFCCSLVSHLLNKFQQLFNLNPDACPPESRFHQRNGKNELGHCGNKTEDKSSDEEEDEEETKRAKLRRRKIGSGSSDQEFSEEEIFLDTNSDVESEEEAVVSDSGFHSAESKIEPLLEIPEEAGSLFPVFKLLCDWIQANHKVLQVPNQTIRLLWIALADVLNVFKRCQKQDTDNFESLPLEEDWMFYGVNALTSVHAKIDFEKHAVPSKTNLNSIRIERLLGFGLWLAQQENNNGFTVENGFFKISPERESTKSDDADIKADSMMRNMAHLWLKSEVQELERKLSPKSKRKKKATFDLPNLAFVYMVPDVSALNEYSFLIKQIVKSQKLIVVIPDVVISELDQLKVNLIVVDKI